MQPPARFGIFGSMSSEYAVEERRFLLELGGERTFEGTCTPSALHALAAGRLLAEGLLSGRRVAAIDVSDQGDTIVLDAHLRPAAAHETFSHVRRPRPSPPPPEALHEMMRELFRAGDQRHPSGGVHVAALSDGERLLHIQTDVGRHNAVDKVLGGALLIDTDTPSLGLVVSARVSGEIARKAAAADVAWIATRSLPTTLAIEIAADAGIPIVARAAARDAYVWGAR